MQQTIERASGRSRPGFLRRLLVRTERGIPEPPAVEPAASIIDLRGDLPPAQWRAAVSERIERLETGISLVSDTMKRAFAQVFRSIEDLREGRADLDRDLARLADDSISSLQSAVEELSDSIRAVPHVLAAAADDITARLEAGSTTADGEDRPIRRIGGVHDPSTAHEVLPATPFELEPVEEQFEPMDETPAGTDPGRIWGSGA